MPQTFPRTLGLLTLAVATLALAGTTQTGLDISAAEKPTRTAGAAVGEEAPQVEAAAPAALRIVGTWNGSRGARSLERSRVEVGDVIVEIEGQEANLENWQQLMREIGRTAHEDTTGPEREPGTVRIRLADGQPRDLEILGTSKVRDGETWRYNAYTGAEVAEGADAPLLPEEPEPEPQQEPTPAERGPESPLCEEIRERFGPRPEGAPCWWLQRHEDAELTEERRQRAISDPENQLPWRSEWAFHPGIANRVPPHRIPEGMEAAPAWQTAGAYQTSQAQLPCPPGSRSRLIGSVRAGTWAAHATACTDGSGQIRSGALIYAQPDPDRCSASPWLWDTCGIARTTLLSMTQPSDGMLPDIPRLLQQEQDIRIADIDGRWHLILPADPQSVPYLEERALQVR